MRNFFKQYIKEIIIGLFIGLFLLVIMQRYFVIATIPSESMENTLMVGDKVYVDNRFDKIERGKIYTFHKGRELLIKRCIGIEGDHIQVKNNDVFLNGEKLEEEYVSSEINDYETIEMDFIVPEGKIFFLGDNRRVSNDARFWAEPFIDEKDVVGLATKVIYPFDRKQYLYN